MAQEYALPTELGYAIYRDPLSVQSNTDPVVSVPIPDLVVTDTEVDSVDLSLNFSDPDPDPLQYTASPALPSGFTLDINTGILDWDGTQVITATAPFLVVCDDQQGGTAAADTFDLTVVSDAPDLPEAGTSNAKMVAFFRAATGLDSYDINQLALAYYKQEGNTTASSFNGSLRAAQATVPFKGLSPTDWRNF